ncbi:hypothetical protein G6L58_07255 [Agrobacterium tumefaciens]|uniref:hypothetical protein n=1 Tax=Agrobacterium tumefaciens TaxID=358 RepID=UPI000EF25F53|nr:hypothetical protein At1D1108_11930 [Agrobacterium tumefaciens]NSY90229.1 hypothetical protein [Agrobacterium tumefaciens]
MKAATLKLPDINFRNIRKHRSSQNDGFEELTRQIVLAEPPAGFSSIENRGPGADGGVEIAVKFPDGRVWGWQSKYFPDTFAASEVSQLRKSFKSALANFPLLERYHIAIPRNLSGSAEGKNETQTKQWNKFKKWCETEAKKKGRTVAIELWDESYFVSKLHRNEARYSGMRVYWFDENSFDTQWFENQLSKSRDYIGKRYRPDDHVDVGINEKLRILRRHECLEERLAVVMTHLEDADTALRDIIGYETVGEPLRVPCEDVRAEIERIHQILCRANSDELYADQLAGCLDDVERIPKESSSYRILLAAPFEKIERADELGRTISVPIYPTEIRDYINNISENIRRAGVIFSVSDRKILRQPALLVEGEAGAGKSHLLAREVESHVKNGHPALFIPARTLDHGDKPEQEILKYLDIADIRFDTFLAALHSAALASGQPALIVVDGLNESWSAAGWQSGLPVLWGQVSKFNRLALCVSVRSSYIDLCVRSDLTIPRIAHYGFNGHVGEAAKEYLDRHGIERFSAPILGLNDLLYNPLFLSTAVDFLVASKQTSFPRGMDSIADIINFWLQAVERNLIDKRFERIALNDNKIASALRTIAAAMATSGSEYLPYDDAYKLCEEALNLAPPAKDSERFLSRLIDEGVLIDTPSRDKNSGKRVSFGFQKFSDYFLAEAILRDCETPENLAEALRIGGKYEYVFRDGRTYEFAGLRIALLALTPIRWKIELIDLDESFTGDVGISVEDFVNSLFWRRGEDTTERTVELLQLQRKPNQDGERGIDDALWFNTLLSLATESESPINASFLKQNLASCPLGERDASWSVYLVGKSQVYEDDWSVVQQLIDWAWVAPKMAIEPRKVHLVAIALALMTSTTDRQLRDCATKALASLLTKYPEEIADVIREFKDWDDSYVRERVLAAAAGAVLYCDDPLHMKHAALAADEMVFKKAPVERHAWTRRYAQVIVEHAVFNKAGLDDVVVARSTPPYASDPIVDWPTLEDVAGQRESARSIFSSVIGFIPQNFDGKPPSMPGDFGNYTMGGISTSFSKEMRGDGLPLTREQEIANVWDKVDALGATTTSLHAELLEISRRIDDAHFSDLLKSVEADNESEDEDSTSEKLELRRTKLIEELVALLPEDLRSEFTRVDPLSRLHGYGVLSFSILQGRYWVFRRALELGWKSALHERVENEVLRYSGGRRDHSVERIGKKYQHIAYGELVGYLADHHWYLDFQRDPEILRKLEFYERADIDPSYFSGVHSKPIEVLALDGFQVPAMEFVVDTPSRNMNWTKTFADIPDFSKYLVQTDDNGTLWAMQNCYRRSKNYMNGFESEAPFRSAQYGIELILVPRSDVEKLAKLTTEELKENNHDVFDHGSTDAFLWGQLSYRHLATSLAMPVDREVASFKFGRPKQSYSPKYTEFDHSGVRDESDLIAPHAAILAHLKLKPKDGWSSVFVSQDGRPAFVDNPNREEGLACYRLDVIEQFAHDHDLKVVWRVWVEKDGGLGTHRHGPHHKQFARNDYIGYFYREDDTWRGELIKFRD